MENGIIVGAIVAYFIIMFAFIIRNNWLAAQS